tara:strand:- start:3372 stop:4019 length:648 start_codon:yes stop_codon:yes gene_type:complete
MTFGLSGAAIAGIAVGGATLISGMAQADAAKSAASTQAGAAQGGIEEQRRQFDAVQKLLQPYTEAGPGALEQQQAFLGLKGPEAERAAIERISGGETYKALAAQGEEALLQRASATGGLRGGNIQAALGQFRPQLLSSLIEQQYGRLGGMTSLGQQSAAGVGTAGLQTGVNVSNLLGQQGAAQAGAEIAQGRAYAAIPQAISGGLGLFSGLGGKF